jgi:hypothetical protein
VIDTDRAIHLELTGLDEQVAVSARPATGTCTD